MRIEDVVPNVELKERIRVFKEERTRKAAEVRMDTTEG
jgi:hypothetical protein